MTYWIQSRWHDNPIFHVTTPSSMTNFTVAGVVFERQSRPDLEVAQWKPHDWPPSVTVTPATVKRPRLDLEPGEGIPEPAADCGSGLSSPSGSPGVGEDAGSTLGPGSILDSTTPSQDNGHSTLSGIPSSSAHCSSPTNDSINCNGIDSSGNSNYLSQPQAWLMNGCPSDTDSTRSVKSELVDAPASPPSRPSSSDGSRASSGDATPRAPGDLSKYNISQFYKNFDNLSGGLDISGFSQHQHPQHQQVQQYDHQQYQHYHHLQPHHLPNQQLDSSASSTDDSRPGSQSGGASTTQLTPSSSVSLSTTATSAAAAAAAGAQAALLSANHVTGDGSGSDSGNSNMSVYMGHGQNAGSFMQTTGYPGYHQTGGQGGAYSMLHPASYSSSDASSAHGSYRVKVHKSQIQPRPSLKQAKLGVQSLSILFKMKLPLFMFISGVPRALTAVSTTEGGETCLVPGAGAKNQKASCGGLEARHVANHDPFHGPQPPSSLWTEAGPVTPGDGRPRRTPLRGLLNGLQQGAVITLNSLIIIWQKPCDQRPPDPALDNGIMGPSSSLLFFLSASLINSCSLSAVLETAGSE
ncbi:hypothetical protein RRG08_029964 [Elysia crispata]|uniref:Uncharacterized protein n=1 Tax=Elysia crispata TaxID=231223 RepID=A0AAE1DGY7_9GAST|nr:hypothetical protein RRG08_029964 [Elysia crispata]